jgi:hypothetical protein
MSGAEIRPGGDMLNSDQSERGVEKRELTVRSLKQIVGHEEGNNPELEPLFANHFEMMRIGTDLYLDIGMVRPEEIVALESKFESREELTVTFHVLQRVAMSPDGFQRLKASVEIIAKAIEGGGKA